MNAMRKFVFVVVAILATVVITPVFAQEGALPLGEYRIVDAPPEGTPLYEQGTNAILEYLENGQPVQVVDWTTDGNWAMAEFGQLAGLVNAINLELVEAKAPEDPNLPPMNPEFVYQIDPNVNAQASPELDTWNEEVQIPDFVDSYTTIDGVYGYMLQSSTGTGEDQARLEWPPADQLGRTLQIPEGYALHVNGVYVTINFVDEAVDDLVFDSENFPRGGEFEQGLYVTLTSQAPEIQSMTIVDGMALIVEERYAQEEFCNRLATAVVNNWARDVILVPTDWPEQFCGDALRVMPVDERPGGTTLPEDLMPVEIP